jgi:oligoribonuclease (3'-5' exoribonuclease)
MKEEQKKISSKISPKVREQILRMREDEFKLENIIDSVVELKFYDTVGKKIRKGRNK